MSNLPMDPIRYTRKDVDRLLARKSKWTVQETQKILDSCFRELETIAKEMNATPPEDLQNFHFKVYGALYGSTTASLLVIRDILDWKREQEKNVEDLAPDEGYHIFQNSDDDEDIVGTKRKWRTVQENSGPISKPPITRFVLRDINGKKQ